MLITENSEEFENSEDNTNNLLMESSFLKCKLYDLHFYQNRSVILTNCTFTL